MIACLQPEDYEAVDSQIREMDAAEGSGNAAFSPLEPLTLEALRQARTLMQRTLLHAAPADAIEEYVRVQVGPHRAVVQ